MDRISLMVKIEKNSVYFSARFKKNSYKSSNITQVQVKIIPQMSLNFAFAGCLTFSPQKAAKKVRQMANS